MNLPSSPLSTPSTAPPTPPADSVHSTVLLLALAAFFSAAAMRVCDGLLPRIGHEFGITPGTAGGVVLVFALAYGLSQLVFGPLGDRYGKARMVCIAMLGCMALSLVAALSANFQFLLVARAAWGAAAAGVIPLAMAWIGDAVPYEERQPTLARFLMGTISGMMAGQFLGGLFADAAAGWRGAFALLSLGYAGVGLLLLTRLRRIGRAPVAAGTGSSGVFGRQLRAVLSQPWTWRVLGATLAEGVLLMGPMAFLPSYLNQRFGVSLLTAASLIALYAVGGLVYAAFARRLVAVLGEGRMVATGGILMGAGFGAWWLSPVAWTAGPVALVVGFGTYLLHNTLQTNATQMAPTARGTAMSSFSFCLFMGQAIGVALAGAAFDRWGAAPILAVPALGLPLLGLAYARARQRRPA